MNEARRVLRAKHCQYNYQDDDLHLPALRVLTDTGYLLKAEWGLTG